LLTADGADVLFTVDGADVLCLGVAAIIFFAAILVALVLRVTSIVDAINAFGSVEESGLEAEVLLDIETFPTDFPICCPNALL
jgi:hypothetical protein